MFILIFYNIMLCVSMEFGERRLTHLLFIASAYERKRVVVIIGYSGEQKPIESKD